jgi:hypothetical protein
VIADVTVIQPNAGHIGFHIGRDHLRRSYNQNVRSLARYQHGVAVPMRRMRILALIAPFIQKTSSNHSRSGKMPEPGRILVLLT